MPRKHVLSPLAARAYYNQFGKKQDSQSFYEDPALDDLVAHANLGDARRVFEFGCGTGRLAARLLEKHLRPTASYFGCDISPVMTGLAERRLEAYGERAQVVVCDGAVKFCIPEGSVDRVVSTYVLDLLSESDIERFFAEARRVMMPGGRVCIASLTNGVNVPSRVVSFLWTSVFRLCPDLVGGCRPIHVGDFVDSQGWNVLHSRVVTPFGVPSEILILGVKEATNVAIGRVCGVST